MIHGILARAWSGCLSAAAVSLIFQGVEMTIGAESEPPPREGQNAEDKAERLMAASCHHLEDVISLLR